MGIRIARALGLSLFALSLCTLSASAANDKVRELEWGDLMPREWNPESMLEALREAQGGELSDDSPEAQRILEKYMTAGRSAPVVHELDGQHVRLPGFVVPLDFEGKEIKEFLLVPYFGACIHVPPPPANQIVYVKTEKAYPLKQLFDAVWVTGTLKAQAFLNDVGDAGYTMEVAKVEPYE